jgi:hypothetical protein
MKQIVNIYTTILLILILYALAYLINLNYDLKSLQYFNSINSASFDQIKFNQCEIIELYSKTFNKQVKYQTTVVSVYFSFKKSKHSKGEYDIWNRNMLLSIDAPLAIFTDHKSKDFIIEARSANRSFTTILFIYNDIWHLMSELELKRNRPYRYNYIYHQKNKDPEGKIHNPELYAVWNLKAFMLAKIANLNKFKSEFFIYTDMGSWRSGVLPHWPDEQFIRLLVDLLSDRMFFAQISDYLFYNPYKDIIEGTFFAGSREAVDDFEKKFYDLHDRRLDQDIFIGKDQTLINIYEFELSKSRNVKLKTWLYNQCNGRDKTRNFDKWWFYQFYFSKREYFDCDYDDKFSILTNL